MNAVIKLDVPEWQIGQTVMVYFPDTMQKTGICELLKEQETQKFFVDESGKITPLPVVVRCKDCKHFSFKEYWADIGHGAKILATDHCPTCDKWADGGCKTDPEGYCFLAERKDTQKATKTTIKENSQFL